MYVCVCVCVESIVYLLILLPRERLNWLNPYLAPLSRGWGCSNPHCQAPMLGGTLHLSPPLEACVPELRLLELCITVLSQQTPEQQRGKHSSQQLTERNIFAIWGEIEENAVLVLRWLLWRSCLSKLRLLGLKWQSHCFESDERVKTNKCQFKSKN